MPFPVDATAHGRQINPSEGLPSLLGEGRRRQGGGTDSGQGQADHMGALRRFDETRLMLAYDEGPVGAGGTQPQPAFRFGDILAQEAKGDGIGDDERCATR